MCDRSWCRANRSCNDCHCSGLHLSISRGIFDNEGIAIFCMLLTYYMWIKAVKSGGIGWGIGTALCYFIWYGTNILISGKARIIHRNIFLL